MLIRLYNGDILGLAVRFSKYLNAPLWALEDNWYVKLDVEHVTVYSVKLRSISSYFDICFVSSPIVLYLSAVMINGPFVLRSNYNRIICIYHLKNVVQCLSFGSVF